MNEQEKEQINRIFIRSLNRLSVALQSHDELMQIHSQRNLQSPLSENEIQLALGEIYNQLEECWMIVDKIRKIRTLTREILELGESIENIN
ncbi:MAG: hypothetical protein OXI43_23215 [Candidatus Poribacteria bacterium]|nr:hypothetical protein [Candidatus Poribacteria bacterium]